VKSLNKALQFVLFCTLLCIFHGQALNAQAGEVFFVPETTYVLPQDTFEIDIEVDEFLTGIHCFKVRVYFDRSLLELLDIVEGPLLSDQGSTWLFVKDTAGAYEIANCLLGAGLYADGPGTLATIKLRAKEFSGNSELSILDHLFQDANLDIIPSASDNGVIVIQGDQNPDVDVLSPPSGETHTEMPELTINIYDDIGIDRGFYQIDVCEESWLEFWSYNSNSSDTTINWTIPLVSEGSHNIYLKVIDDAGNVNFDSCSYSWDFIYTSGFLCGDANGDQNVNVSDAVWIINFVFVGGEPPDPYASGDGNCDGTVNVSDAVWIINYVFVGGYLPCDTNGDDILDC